MNLAVGYFTHECVLFLNKDELSKLSDVLLTATHGLEGLAELFVWCGF